MWAHLPLGFLLLALQLLPRADVAAAAKGFTDVVGALKHAPRGDLWGIECRWGQQVRVGVGGMLFWRSSAPHTDICEWGQRVTVGGGGTAGGRLREGAWQHEQVAQDLHAPHKYTHPL